MKGFRSLSQSRCENGASMRSLCATWQHWAMQTGIICSAPQKWGALFVLSTMIFFVFMLKAFPTQASLLHDISTQQSEIGCVDWS